MGGYRHHVIEADHRRIHIRVISARKVLVHLVAHAPSTESLWSGSPVLLIDTFSPSACTLTPSVYAVLEVGPHHLGDIYIPRRDFAKIIGSIVPGTLPRSDRRGAKIRYFMLSICSLDLLRSDILW